MQQERMEAKKKYQSVKNPPRAIINRTRTCEVCYKSDLWCDCFMDQYPSFKKNYESD